MKLTVSAEEKRNTVVYALILIALAAGTALGSIYLSGSWETAGEGIRQYLGTVFEGAGNATPSYGSLLLPQLITVGIIFVMGFFHLGFIVTGAVIIRKGFVAGFTAASFVRVYGTRGLLGLLAASPMTVITVPLLVIYSAVSVIYSVNKNKFQKKFIFSYIFFTIFVISIFCAVSFAEGHLATTFMKWFLP